jgi:hypothetical protein
LTWHGQEWLEPTPLTCDEVCATATFGTASCHANGCSGLTGFVCETTPLDSCEIFHGNGPLLLDLSGACDESIPWPEVIFGWDRHVYCCCG